MSALEVLNSVGISSTATLLTSLRNTTKTDSMPFTCIMNVQGMGEGPNTLIGVFGLQASVKRNRKMLNLATNLSFGSVLLYDKILIKGAFTFSNQFSQLLEN